MTAPLESAFTQLKAEAGELQHMRHWLDAKLLAYELDSTLREQLVLAVNEACMNVIQHAYGGSADGEIRISLERYGNRLVIELEDDAPCIDPARVKPRGLDELRPGGLGVHFIREILDEVAFLPCGEQGNRLRMIKWLGKERTEI
jgi:anti-sigma regulatory factor (Ser/Thr protein kinase)